MHLLSLLNSNKVLDFLTSVFKMYGYMSGIRDGFWKPKILHVIVDIFWHVDAVHLKVTVIPSGFITKVIVLCVSEIVL